MELTSWFGRCPVVAILRGVRPDESEAIVGALEASGIVVAEVPMNSPDPLGSIRRLHARYGERMLIGAGTVMRPAQVDEIARAGGRLIVTPHADPTIVRAAREAGLFTIPGFFTPAEAFAMLDAGAHALKMFPAEAASPRVLKALRAVLPATAHVVPVGGIDALNLGPWLAAGASAVGVGSSLYRPGDDAATVGGRAGTLVAAVAAARAAVQC
ncbi:MAG: 2-dehydro-3-deoxy-6-phosphogalactonate aldolase [Gemmatimonadales bacterium]